MGVPDRRDIALRTDAGVETLRSPRFNPRIARGLAWLDAESSYMLTAEEGPTDEYVELLFPGAHKLGYFCPLTSIPNVEFWPSPGVRSPLRVWNHSLDSHELMGRISVSKSEPLMLVLSDLDGVPVSDFDYLRQFAPHDVLVVDASGCAGCGPDGVWNGATGHVVQYLRDYKNLLALSLNLSGATDADLEPISSLSKLQYLDLTDTEVTDAGLRNLSMLSDLRHLHLANDSISGVGLYHITPLRLLEYLDLSMNTVSGKHLVHLRGMDQLTHLDLSSTNMSDGGFLHLTTLPQLSRLCLKFTHVTLPGLRAFLRQRPEIEIVNSLGW